MTPSACYLDQVEKDFIVSDPQQLAAMQYLDTMYLALMQEQRRRTRFFSFLHKRQVMHGLYLWGGVGIGKTFMMDCFFACIPFPQKMRMHFYQFMQMVHTKLKQHQGEADPLRQIAKEISRDVMLLCFDEFFVSDITDAMLLGRLFRALFAEGLSVVMTSNVAPNDLYKNGLQRVNFLPTIALLKQQLQVVHLDSKVDYRLRHLQAAGVFYTPLDAAAERNMEKAFAGLAQNKFVSKEPVMILDRAIPVRQRTEETIWFEFSDICRVPRSQQDYLMIAKQYKTVLISDVPVVDEKEKDTICLFISLIDVLYDARVRIVLSAAEPIEKIYHRGFMIMEYTRTHSRLAEMLSQDYFINNEL